jgi:hypothetical protein
MKKLSLIKIITIAIAPILFYACSESISVKEEAVEMTVQQIIDSPTSSWFGSAIAYYSPDTNIVKQIKTDFNPNLHKLYFFTDLSCGCAAQATDIAHIVKTLRDAGISDTVFKIYSMRKITYAHPDTKFITVNILPTGVLYKDSLMVCSILDSLAFLPNVKVESILLNNLKK